MLRPEGLSYRRYVVIVKEPPGLTGRDLVRGLGVSEPAVSGLIRALIHDGLVENMVGQGVGNVRCLRATSAGTAKQQHCAELLGDSFDRTARSIGLDPVLLAGTVRALHDALCGTDGDRS